MKKILTRGIVPVLVLLAHSLSAAETAPSRITEVTLFSSQALVTRTAEVLVTAGPNEIQVSVGAFQVDPDSVTAKVFGEGRILAVQYREVPVARTPQDKVRNLEDRLGERRWRERALQDEKAVLERQEAFLNSVVRFAETQVPQDMKTNFPGTESLQGTLEFLGSRFESLAKRKEALDREMEGLHKEIKALEEELSMIRRPAGKVEKFIEILFQGDKDQTVRVEAGYVVGDAHWRPLYRASVPLSLDGVDLTMFSSVLQKTGEDWNQADLVVSNVIPLKGVKVPEPDSWVLDILRPLAGLEGKMSSSDRARAAAPMAVLKEESENAAPEAAFAEAARTELPLSFEYRFPRAVDIPSREKETLLPLFTRNVDGAFFDLAVPRLSPLTFLVCRAKGDGEILAGPLNVYFGGRYVGKTYLGEKKPGEAFDFNLGADREVKVTRTKAIDKVRETYFGRVERGTVVREMGYVIGVENLKKKEVTLRVLDAVPVSRTDRIEVKDVKLLPEPDERNYRDKEGVHLWTLDLKPGETREISIAFVVTYPRETPPPGF